jgi:hypothetical protein
LEEELWIKESPAHVEMNWSKGGDELEKAGTLFPDLGLGRPHGKKKV